MSTLISPSSSPVNTWKWSACHKKDKDSNWGPIEKIGSLYVFLLLRRRERGLRRLENLEAGTLKKDKTVERRRF